MSFKSISLANTFLSKEKLWKNNMPFRPICWFVPMFQVFWFNKNPFSHTKLDVTYDEEIKLLAFRSFLIQARMAKLNFSVTDFVFAKF